MEQLSTLKKELAEVYQKVKDFLQDHEILKLMDVEEKRLYFQSKLKDICDQLGTEITDDDIYERYQATFEQDTSLS